MGRMNPVIVPMDLVMGLRGRIDRMDLVIVLRGQINILMGCMGLIIVLMDLVMGLRGRIDLMDPVIILMAPGGRSPTSNAIRRGKGDLKSYKNSSILAAHS